MNTNLIESILKYLTEVFKIHVGYCHHGDQCYVEDFYISKNDIKCCGEDIINYLYETYGLTEDESKIIINYWVDKKIPNEKVLSDPKFSDVFWRKTKYVFCGSTYTSITVTGCTITNITYVN